MHRETFPLGLVMATISVVFDYAVISCIDQSCYYQNSNIVGKTCTDNVMFVVSNVRSKLECVEHCGDECWSVFYSSSTGQCHGCKGIYDTSNMLGTLYGSVYYIKNWYYEYMGCYTDCQNTDPCTRRVVDQEEIIDYSMTTEMCVNHCKAFGLKYLATQNHVRCACGDNYDTDGPANNCDDVCYGNSSQMCGGFSANSVYRFVLEC